jgi:tRNA A37 methylthiotransferase MiaB
VCREVLLDRIDVYKYDERPNTPSLRLKGRLSEEIKQRRYEKMRILATVDNVKRRIKRRRLSPSVVQNVKGRAIGIF